MLNLILSASFGRDFIIFIIILPPFTKKLPVEGLCKSNPDSYRDYRNEGWRGQGEVMQLNSYYPFGMNIKRLTTRGTIADMHHSANQYLYYCFMMAFVLLINISSMPKVNDIY